MFLDCVAYFGVLHWFHDDSGDEVHGHYNVLFDCGEVVPCGAVARNDVVHCDSVVQHDGAFLFDDGVHGDNVVHECPFPFDDGVHDGGF
jgi:hypothetical protein